MNCQPFNWAPNSYSMKAILRRENNIFPKFVMKPLEHWSDSHEVGAFSTDARVWKCIVSRLIEFVRARDREHVHDRRVSAVRMETTVRHICGCADALFDLDDEDEDAMDKEDGGSDADY